MHAHDLTQIALVILFALMGGLLLLRIKQPPIIGYILAGVLLGPSCLGWVHDRAAVETLAELGVLMLLFSIGMELNIRVFKKIWLLSFSAVALQIGASGLFFFLIHGVLGISQASALLFSAIFALSSTAVAVKMLESIGQLSTTSGKVILSILIGQDLAFVPIVIALRGAATDLSGVIFWIQMAAAVGVLGLIVYGLGRSRRLSIPIVSFLTAGDRDLLPLASLVLCFGVASVAGILGLSAAYGAFLAGLVIGNTRERHKILEASIPIGNILLMVFFLSVGLLLDLGYVWNNLLTIFSGLLLLTLGKTSLNTVIMRALQQPWSRAILAGLILSQIGEFAFVLATVGLENRIIDENGQKLIIALTVLSLSLSPLWVGAARRLQSLAPEPLMGLRQIVDTIYVREWNILCSLWRGGRKIWERFRGSK